MNKDPYSVLGVPRGASEEGAEAEELLCPEFAGTAELLPALCPPAVPEFDPPQAVSANTSAITSTIVKHFFMVFASCCLLFHLRKI